MFPALTEASFFTNLGLTAAAEMKTFFLDKSNLLLTGKFVQFFGAVLR